MTRGAPMVLLAALVAASTARAGPTTSKPAPPSSDAGRTASTTTSRVDPVQAARLQRIMVPLIRVMDHPMPLDQVKVGITHPGTADLTKPRGPAKDRKDGSWTDTKIDRS